MRWPVGVDPSRAGSSDPDRREVEGSVPLKEAEKVTLKPGEKIVLGHGSPTVLPANGPSGGPLVPVPYHNADRDITAKDAARSSPQRSEDNPAHPWDYDVLMHPENYSLFRKMEKLPVRFMKLAPTASEMCFPIAPPLSFADPDLAAMTTPPTYKTFTVQRGEAFLAIDGVLIVVI